jgi:hypothetical protein
MAAKESRQPANASQAGRDALRDGSVRPDAWGYRLAVTYLFS